MAFSLFAVGALFAYALPELGWWAPVVALLPYSFAHLAFHRSHTARITYRQTIRSLARIPEVAGLSPDGHSDRTADLAVSVATELGLNPHDVQLVEFAAGCTTLDGSRSTNSTSLRSASLTTISLGGAPRSSLKRRISRTSPRWFASSTIRTGGRANARILTCPCRPRSSRLPQPMTTPSTSWVSQSWKRWRFYTEGPPTTLIQTSSKASATS